MNQLDDNGNEIHISPDTILIPNKGKAAIDQKKNLFEWLNADGNPDTANRRGIYNAGRFTIIEWNFLPNPAALTDGQSWCVMYDKKFVDDAQTFAFYERTPFAVHSYVAESNDENIWKGRSRFTVSPGPIWRGAAMNLPGGGGDRDWET